MDVSTAIEKIYRHYFGLFLSIGRKNYGLDYETSKEKIQEAFALVWKKKNIIKAENEAGIRSYIFTAFRNVCLSHCRRPDIFVKTESIDMDPNQTENSSSPLENMADIGSNPLYEMLLIEEARLQDTAIEKLPLKYRETVKLSLKGVKRKEIANMLGVKETSIHNLKHRGLKKYEKIINRLDPLRKI